MRRCFSIIISVVVINILLVSCWDYSEIDESSIVLGNAVDYDEENKSFITTLEIASPKKKGEETIMESQVIKGTGETFYDSIMNVITKSGKKITGGHGKVLIISKKVASMKKEFVSVLDVFKRDIRPRDDIWILMSSEETAGEILSDTNVELQPITSLYLESMIKNGKSLPKYPQVPLYKFIDDLSAEGICPTLPMLL